jgi:hypothetical protein
LARPPAISGPKANNGSQILNNKKAPPFPAGLFYLDCGPELVVVPVAVRVVVVRHPMAVMVMMVMIIILRAGRVDRAEGGPNKNDRQRGGSQKMKLGLQDTVPIRYCLKTMKT